MTELRDQAQQAQQAQQARATLEDIIVDALSEQPEGLYNELARLLDLESAYEGRQSNYLTYSLSGGLLTDGRVKKEKRTAGPII